MTTTMQDLDLDQPLRLHPLTYLDEGDEVTAGRADTSSFGLFPADGAALLRQLEAGRPPADAARWYAGQYGQEVDIAGFLEVLGELGLIAAEGEQTAAGQGGPRVRWQRLGRALFSPPAWAAYAALAAAAVAAVIRQPALAPSYGHLFFTRSSLVILMLGTVAGQLPLVLLHESFHALAGRRLGLNSTLRVGRRFYYVVFVTSLDGLVAVPRAKRYLPMLAGLIADTLAVAALTLAAAPLLHATGAAGLAGRLLLSMAFGGVLRFAWQFYFFLRTDLYYLATTAAGCNDLQTVARALLVNRFWRLAGRPGRMSDPAEWHPRDAAIARWYSWLMAGGYVLLTVMLVTTAFPVGARLTAIAWHELTSARSPARIADALAFLGLNFWEPALAAGLAVASWRRRRRPARAVTES
jgi:hypothetical protein